MKPETKIAKEIIDKIYCPDYLWQKRTPQFIEFRTWLIFRIKEVLNAKK